MPDIPGGVEKHCQELYPRIAAQGHEVTLSVRSCYAERRMDAWRRIKLVYLYAPRIKSIEALVHTLISLIMARACRSDIVHIHAIGPSLLTPIARLLGLKVVVTHHGPEYERAKWGRLARFVLRLGEGIGAIERHRLE